MRRPWPVEVELHCWKHGHYDGRAVCPGCAFEARPDKKAGELPVPIATFAFNQEED